VARAVVDKRREVIERAVAVFSARGYRGTSMNDISEAVGLSKSTLYHYFKGKEDLLVAIYEDVLEDNVLAAQRILDRSLSTQDELSEMMVDRVVYTCKNRRILQIFFEEEAELPRRLMPTVLAGRHAYEAVMTGLIDRGVAEGVFVISTSSTIVANSFLGAANWIYKWYQPRGPKSPEELGKEIAGLLMRSIAAP